MRRFLLIGSILILTHCGAYAQWVKIHDNAGNVAIIGNNILVTAGDLIRSTDFGKTWIDSTFGIPGSIDLTFLFPWRSKVFLGNSFYYDPVLVSDDSGMYWQGIGSSKGFLGRGYAMI